MTYSLSLWNLPARFRAIGSSILVSLIITSPSVIVLAMSNLEFHVAPMQCYTNLPFRRLCSSLSPKSIYWTEMEKADDLLPDIKESLIQRLGDQIQEQQEHHKLVLQLGSNDPHKVQECVKAAIALDYGHLKEINLNCGCPAIDSGGAPTYGASLMKDPTLTASLVESCVRNCQQLDGHTDNVDVSVKCRIGVVEHADDLTSSESSSSSPAYDYERLHHYVSKIQEAGANHVILHARPAVLAGLSPVKNRIVPTLQYDMAYQVAEDFPKLKVTLNGGIRSLSQLKEENDNSSTISSFMAGRWILQRPLDLIGIEGWLQEHQRHGSDRLSALPLDSTNPEMDAFSVAKDAIEDYFDYCIMQSTAKSKTGTTTASDLCLPLFLVVEQLREDYDDNDDLDDYPLHPDHNTDLGDKSPDRTVPAPMVFSYEEMESLYDLLEEGVSELSDCMGKGGKSRKNTSSSVNFKRLSTSFKSLVGTKVANKWKRNRAEL